MAQALEKMQGEVAMEKFYRKFGRRSQVTIPKEIVNELAMQEGDMLRVMKAGHAIILVPVKTIPKGAMYFEPGSYTEVITEQDIKQAIADAQSEYKEGKLKGYENIDKLFEDLDIDIGDE